MQYRIIILVALCLVSIGCSSSEGTPGKLASTLLSASPTLEATLQVTATPVILPTLPSQPTIAIPTEIPNPASQLAEIITVELVTEPLSNLDSGVWTDFGPRIAVGDVTGDTQPELFFAAEGGSYTEAEGVFWRHPVVFSWNGTTFEKWDVNWVGLLPPTPNLSTSDRQGLPTALAIVDIDQDGANEVIAGTAPYRNTSEYGAVYIFQWNGSEFISEYSDYCLGAVYRLDVLDDKTDVALSTFERPITEKEASEKVCPEISKGPNEPNSGLYLLYSPGAGLYQSRPLTLDRDWLTALALNIEELNTARFIRFEVNRGLFRWNWATARLVGEAGQITSENDFFPQTNYLGRYAVATDLDNDRVDEIIILTGKNTELGNIFVWQVLKKLEERYHLVFEGGESEPVERDILSFTTGDIDNDGLEEVVDNTGRVYKWDDDQLCYQGNLIQAINEKLQYGFESIYIGDIHGTGLNSIVFTGHPLKSDAASCPPLCGAKVYVVSLDSLLSTDICR